jgi:F0F1-type ATP synthase membrane subunit c/vacuolar-type H+-ATPase subunit K
LQAEEYPIYEWASIAVGVGLAWATGLPNPIFSGIVSGLAAGKGYDLIANNKKKKK